MRIGTAGWAIPRASADAFPDEGSHLARYARVLGCVEINSSFHRPHRRAVYERWAAGTPPDFRFAVKLPRAITHDARLRRARLPLRTFLDDAAGLGERLAVVLVQLPPSFAFESRPVRAFFALLAEMFTGAIVCEPRHPSWFTLAADRALVAARVARAAADPPACRRARKPGAGSAPTPMAAAAVLTTDGMARRACYWSQYTADWIDARARELRRWPAEADTWCVFDNTASGAALANALELRSAMQGVDRAR